MIAGGSHCPQLQQTEAVVEELVSFLSPHPYAASPFREKYKFVERQTRVTKEAGGPAYFRQLSPLGCLCL